MSPLRSGLVPAIAAFLAALALATAAAGSELQIQQVEPGRTAVADCPAGDQDCAAEAAAREEPCVRNEEGDLPPGCPAGAADGAAIEMDALVPRLEDPEGDSGTPLIPGVTINKGSAGR